MKTRVAIVALAAAGALLVDGSGAHAGLLSYLSEEQRKEALAHGRATFDKLGAEGRPIDNMEPEYVADLRPEGHAVLLTEFGALALEARRWRAIGREMTPKDVEAFMRPREGRLQFIVTLPVPERDYLHLYEARLVQQGKPRELVRWMVFRGVPEPHVSPPRLVAVGEYVFASQALDPDAPITLILTHAGGKEIRFEFDLSRLR